MKDRLKSKFLKSILYFSVSQTFGKIVNGLAFIVLLKILSPGELGLVSIAAVFVTILSAVSEAGMEAAVIQAPTITGRQKNGIFWIGIGLSGAVYAAVFFAAPNIAVFYKEPVIEPLIRVYMLVLFVNAFKIIPYSLLVRDLKFGKISVIESVSMVISSALMISLAYRGMGPWSLVWAEIARVFCVFSGSQLSSFFIPGIRFSIKEITPLLSFGFFATASRILYNFYTNIDYLIVGRFFGAATVGIYTLAYRLVFDTLKAGTGMINKVAYPTFSRLQKDLPRLRRYFFSIARMNLSVLGLFLLMTAFFFDWAMLALGYEKWLAAVPIIRLFCLIGFLRCIVPLIPQLLNSLGQSKMNFYYSALCAAVMPAAFYFGARISISGVVWAWLLVYPLTASLLLYFALKNLQISFRKFATEFTSSLKILLVSTPIIFLAGKFFKIVPFGSELLNLLITVLLSLASGLLLILIFDKQMAAEILSIAKRTK